MKKKPSLKLISTFLVMALTLYPPLELTRLIIYQMQTHEFISYRVSQMFEIPIIWVSYIAAMIVVYKMLDSNGVDSPWDD